MRKSRVSHRLGARINPPGAPKPMPTLDSGSMPSEAEGDEARPSTQELEAGPDSAELAALGPLVDRLEPPPRLLPGTVLADSFEIETVVGSGGMGIVYRARDLALGRHVAVKLHRPMTHGTERLLREAASMAKLTHPNVATVHEVGTHDGMLFIAMELVEGVTARRWVNRRERSPTEIVELYLAAGEGLAAAHRVGLVHRDFKPENVLVDSDDVPRVLDFGLARLGTEVSEHAPSSDSRLPTSADALTVTGAVMGTPAYMAPEQFAGGDVDARADQFSYCVSLYEALYGERPFEGESAVRVLLGIAQGAIRSPPAGTRVPSKLRQIMLRGLATKADDRWPSMRALLDELQRVVAPRSRRWLPLGIVLGALGLGGGIVLGRGALAASRCSDALRHLTNIWDDTRREEVARAILGTDLGHAPATWERVERRLDDYADAWADKHTEVCEASTADKQAKLDRRLRLDCVQERSRALRAAVDQLARADAEVVDRAVRLVADLPTLTWCDDLDALRSVVPLPEDPELRQAAEALREQLADIRAAQGAGRFVPALDQIEAVVEGAQTLGYEPLVVEAMAQRGRLHSATGDYDAAERDLKAAYEAAIEHHLDDVALSAAQGLTSVVGDHRAQYVRGAEWGGVALAHARRGGDPVDVAISLQNLGQVVYARGDYGESRSYFEPALEMLESALGSDHPRVAVTLAQVGLAYDAVGDEAQARRYLERGLRTREQALGMEHPELASHLSNLGNLLRDQGEYQAARKHHERALRISEAALGPSHPDVAMALNNLGLVLVALGEHEKALPMYERATQIFDDVLGAEHPDAATSRGNVGNLLVLQGQYEQARQHLERSVNNREEALGSDHPDFATGLLDLGDVLEAQGEYEQAQTYYERAMRIQQRELGADHPRVAPIANSLAAALKNQGKYEQAQRHLEHALRIVERTHGSDHVNVSASLNNLANVLRARGEYERAGIHLERALAISETARGADHPKTAVARMSLGNVLEARGRYEQAQRQHERALDTLEATLGADHPAVATCLNNLGNALRPQGKDESARGHLERAVRIFEARLGKDHPNTAHPHVGLARVALAMDEPATARTHAERAVVIREGAQVAPELLAEAQFVLARALWSDTPSQGRAVQLAEQARDALASGEVSGNADVDQAEVERWLASHRAR